MLHALLLAVVSTSIAAPACDIAIESAGGSKAGAAFSFTVSSTAPPLSVTVTVAGDAIHTASVTEKQESITVTIPEDARGKTLEIVAENKDGCLVSWTEAVQ